MENKLYSNRALKAMEDACKALNERNPKHQAKVSEDGKSILMSIPHLKLPNGNGGYYSVASKTDPKNVPVTWESNHGK